MATVIEMSTRGRSATAGKDRRVDFTLSTKQAPIPEYVSPNYKPRHQEEFSRTSSSKRKEYQPGGKEKLCVPGYNGAYISGLSGGLGDLVQLIFSE